VYSEADRDSLPVLESDERICIGPPPSGKSYLSVPSIVSAAVVTGCDAVHPGYGFLSEDYYFAEICAQYGLTFVGPSPEAIARVGNKSEARRAMAEAGLPVLPGSREPVTTVDEAQAVAREIGYPVILKAAAGGGGRGMHVARDSDSLAGGFALARSEARAAFDSDEVYLEKYLEHCRHVEVQVLGDTFGTVVHLGERECSVQRRHQKLIEEAPASIPEATRVALGQAAVQGAKALNYVSAGTLEFLVDDTGRFYFMEMNTRVQVEHGITELVTGIDIVREQLLIASGSPLSFSQDDVRVEGHAVECRVNAESGTEFRPVAGTVVRAILPGGPGIRVDSHLYSGYTVPPHYDSLMAKVMAYGSTRGEAIARMRRALIETRTDGVDNTIPFLLEVIDDPIFVAGNVHTDYVEQRLRGQVA
jgi:acetyl-CoA carboxylase biotin carboxylase subunit